MCVRNYVENHVEKYNIKYAVVFGLYYTNEGQKYAIRGQLWKGSKTSDKVEQTMIAMETREKVENAKKVLHALVRQQQSVTKWIGERIDYLLLCDILYPEVHGMELGMTYLQAYMELGFCYEDQKVLFDRVLGEWDTCRELQFPRKLFPSKRIAVNKSQIKNAVGKWSRRNSMTGTEVVEDILKKVTCYKEGYFQYPKSKGANLDQVGRIELFVGTEEVYLYNKQKNMYFVFENSKKTGENNEDRDRR